MVVMMVVFWAAVIALVVWAFTRVAGTREELKRPPLDIAKERLARGEISTEEFERIKHQLV